MKIEEQQWVARQVLEKLEIIDPACILAGGAPRNWFMNKTANDLDFYIHLDETLHHTELRFKRLGLEVKHIDYNSTKWKAYGIMPKMFRIFELKFMGMDIQIMCMRQSTFDCVVQDFGVSICKFWWKGRDVVPTNDALISILTKTLYVKDDYSAKELHVDKMVKYFPDYNVKPYSVCAEDIANLLTFREYSELGSSRQGVTYGFTERLRKLVKETV